MTLRPCIVRLTCDTEALYCEVTCDTEPCIVRLTCDTEALYCEVTCDTEPVL